MLTVRLPKIVAHHGLATWFLNLEIAFNCVTPANCLRHNAVEACQTESFDSLVMKKKLSVNKPQKEGNHIVLFDVMCGSVVVGELRD